MASGIITLSSNKDVLEGRIVWSSTSNGSSANSSNVYAEIQARRNDGYETKGTWTGTLNINEDKREFSNSSTTVGSTWVTMKSFTITKVHNSDGTGNCWISGWVNGPSGTSMEGYGVEGGQTVALDTIPRYATITSFSVKSKTLTSVTLQFSAYSTLDWVQYMFEGGSWTDLNANNTITGLSPNTTYKIRIQVRRKDSKLWTTSSYISVTTYDIGKITSASNFNHGDSTTISITNPSGSSLNLVMKIGSTQIISKTPTTGSNLITFRDTELDKIYKLYGSGNTLTATFILTTAGTYTNSKTATITLKGNQKTAYTAVSGTKKRAKVFVGVNETVKRAVVWIGNNGRKRCI